MTVSDHLQGILDTLPARPGCYIMKSAGGEIIYKFIVTVEQGPVLYEDRPAHSRHLPESGYVIHQHRWS